SLDFIAERAGANVATTDHRCCRRNATCPSSSGNRSPNRSSNGIDELVEAHGRVGATRPPKWLAEPKPEMSTESQKRRVLSPKARKRISESQRRRWAARRKAES